MNMSYITQNLQKKLVENNRLLQFHECENIVLVKNKPKRIKEYVFSQVFTITQQGTHQFELPLEHNRSISILGYGVKALSYVNSTTLTPTIDPTAVNRLWVDPQNGHKKFGGEEGHEITPFRGRFFKIHSPTLYFNRPAIVIQATPHTSAPNDEAKIRVMLKLAVFNEVN